MTTNLPATAHAGTLTVASDQAFWTEQQRAALVQLGLEDAPNADLAVFLHYCQRTGMDPFAKQIYMIGRWDGRAQRLKYTIQMAIDGFRIIAERSHQYAGQTEPQWCGEDGIWRDVWVNHATPPVAARIGVHRHGWPQPTYSVAHFAEFAPRKKDGNLEPMWQRMPANQLAKCAEAGSLRKAFPHDLSGMYIPEEMEQADIPAIVPGEVEDLPPEQIDWDARIRECDGAVDALIKLHAEAKGIEPNNLDLLERIAAAGRVAREATETVSETAA